MGTAKATKKSNGAELTQVNTLAAPSDPADKNDSRPNALLTLTLTHGSP